MAKNKPTSLAEYGLSKKSGLGAPAFLFWGSSAELDREKLSNLDVCAILNQQYHSLRTRFHISTPSIRCLYNRFAVTHGEYFVMGPDAMDDGGKRPFVLRCEQVPGRCDLVGEAHRLRGPEPDVFSIWQDCPARSDPACFGVHRCPPRQYTGHGTSR
ncbi:HET domain-containing protein [Metarhizium brunneum]